MKIINPHEKIYYTRGVIREGFVGFSEVAMFLRVAGEPMGMKVVGPERSPMVQLYTRDNTPFSFPITVGEAGLYQDSEDRVYGYAYEEV